MKRSEVTKLIAEILSENLQRRYFDINFDDVASEVLTKLENIGMEPPFSTNIYYKVWRDGGTGNQWEQE